MEWLSSNARSDSHKRFPKKSLYYCKGFAIGWWLRHQEAEPNAENGYIWLAVIRSLLMGLERRVVAQQFCRTDRVIRLWIAIASCQRLPPYW